MGQNRLKIQDNQVCCFQCNSSTGQHQQQPSEQPQQQQQQPQQQQPQQPQQPQQAQSQQEQQKRPSQQQQKPVRINLIYSIITTLYERGNHQ